MTHPALMYPVSVVARIHLPDGAILTNNDDSIGMKAYRAMHEHYVFSEQDNERQLGDRALTSLPRFIRGVHAPSVPLYGWPHVPGFEHKPTLLLSKHVHKYAFFEEAVVARPEFGLGFILCPQRRVLILVDGDFFTLKSIVLKIFESVISYKDTYVFGSYFNRSTYLLDHLELYEPDTWRVFHLNTKDSTFVLFAGLLGSVTNARYPFSDYHVL